MRQNNKIRNIYVGATATARLFPYGGFLLFTASPFVDVGEGGGINPITQETMVNTGCGR